MDKKKWLEALQISRFINKSEAFHAKVEPILTYVSRLENRRISTCSLSKTYTLKTNSLRQDKKVNGLSTHELKQLSSHFLDSYFVVPKVLEGEESL